MKPKKIREIKNINYKNILLFFLLLGVVLVVVGCINKSEMINKEVTNANFSIIVLPDTQKEILSYESFYQDQIRWIIKNKQTLNIIAVAHVGDMVDNYDSPKQWITFEDGIKELEASNIPYILALGNHDHPSVNYREIFPVSRFANKPWWGGSMGNDTVNAFIVVNFSNEKFMLIKLDYCPNKDEIAWANSVLDKYPDTHQILITHAYLDLKAGYHPSMCSNTVYIWDDVVRKHQNLQLVFSGHEHGVSSRTDLNDAGKSVYQMLADYQAIEKGGNGWLRIIQFVPSEKKVYVKTFSPSVNDYYPSVDSALTLDYPAVS